MIHLLLIAKSYDDTNPDMHRKFTGTFIEYYRSEVTMSATSLSLSAETKKKNRVVFARFFYLL